MSRANPGGRRVFGATSDLVTDDPSARRRKAQQPGVRPTEPFDPKSGVSMRDIRFRIRCRAALDRLRARAEDTVGDELSLLLGKLEALSPPEGEAR